MYGLTDNIVAGPAGHTVAGPAGSFTAGPAGSFTPAPGAYVPVSGAGYIPYSGGGYIPYSGGGFVPYTEAGHVPITEGGHVPIDTASGHITHQPSSGGMLYTEGSTLSAIPGASAHVPVSQASGGGGGGIGIGGGAGGGGGGGGAYSLGGSILGGGGGGGGGAGMNYMTISGAAMPPMELRVGQAVANATGSAPTTPGTEGFTVSPGGRTVPTPTGYVHPPRASHFHGSPMTHVAHHPTRVENNTVTTEAYQPYKASYVWPGRPEGTPPPPFLAGDYVKPSSYDPPHVVFSDEKPGPRPVVDDSIGGSGLRLTQVNNQSFTLDFTQPRSVEYSTHFEDSSKVVLDNSQTRTQNFNQQETRQVDTSLDFSQTNNADLSTTQQRTTQLSVEEAARVTNLFFLDGPSGSPAAMSMGNPVLTRLG